MIRPFTCSWWVYKFVQSFWRAVWQYLVKSKALSPFDLVVSILPRNDSHLCTSILLLQHVHINIARATWCNQHKYPSRILILRRMEKLQYITTMGYYTAGNRTELELCVSTWKNLMLRDKRHIT